MGAEEEVWVAVGDCVCFAGELDLADLVIVILDVFQTVYFHQIIKPKWDYDLEFLYPENFTYGCNMRTNTHQIFTILQIDNPNLPRRQPNNN